MDIVYLIDSSYGVSFDTFEAQIEFVETMMDCAAKQRYAFEKYRRSVISYGDIVKKLFGFDDEVDVDMISEDDMVGGDPFTDEALDAALLELIENGKDGNEKAVFLISNSAPLTNHELCLGDYVSPQLEELHEMGVFFANVGINLSDEVAKNMECLNEFGGFVNAKGNLNSVIENFVDCDGGDDIYELDTQIIVLLDTSADVTYSNFMDQVTFVDTMKDCFGALGAGHVTDEGMEISVMLYGDKVMDPQELNDGGDIGDVQMVGGDRNMRGALARALQQFEKFGEDGADKFISLFSFGAPVANHEPCLDDYVSPALQKLRDMGVVVTFHGIGLDTVVMDNLKCMVSVSDDVDEEDQFTNTESATALADQWGYTACAYGEDEEDE